MCHFYTSKFTKCMIMVKNVGFLGIRTNIIIWVVNLICFYFCLRPQGLLYLVRNKVSSSHCCPPHMAVEFLYHLPKLILGNQCMVILYTSRGAYILRGVVTIWSLQDHIMLATLHHSMGYVNFNQSYEVAKTTAFASVTSFQCHLFLTTLHGM